MNWRRDIYASYVNLDHRQDRYDHMQRELRRVGLEYELRVVRQPGKLPKDIPFDSRHDVMRNRTPGAIGCHLSQVEIMQKAYENKSSALVMEDDIIFCSDIQQRLDYISDWTKKNEWDVIWLSAPVHVNPPFWHKHGQSGMRPNCSAQLGYDAKLTEDKHMIRTYGAFATFAYLVNYHSIPKILQMFNQHLHESIGIDWLFIKLQPQLNCFSFVPGCVKQIDNMSDIGTGMTVWSGHLRLGPYVFQDNINDFDPLTFNWAECK